MTSFDPPTVPAQPEPHQAAEIFSRGYREYDGARRGLVGVMWAVTIHSWKFVMGIGRPARFKIAPWLLTGLNLLQVIGIIAALVLIRFVAPENLFGGEPADYADAITGNFVLMVLFTAIVIPGILVSDRQNGLYLSYLTSGLSPLSYIASKAVAVWSILMFFTTLPAVVLLFGSTFVGAGPGGVTVVLSLLARSLVAGFVVAVLFGTLAMTTSAMTNRTLLASVAVAAVLFGSAQLGNSLVNAQLGRGWSLVSIFTTASELVGVVFGLQPTRGLTETAVLVAAIAWFASGAAVVIWRYVTLEELR